LTRVSEPEVGGGAARQLAQLCQRKLAAREVQRLRVRVPGVVDRQHRLGVRLRDGVADALVDREQRRVQRVRVLTAQEHAVERAEVAQPGQDFVHARGVGLREAQRRLAGHAQVVAHHQREALDARLRTRAHQQPDQEQGGEQPHSRSLFKTMPSI
jgi:hypothetical protein